MTTASIDRIYVQVMDDPDGDASWLEQDGFEDRFAAYAAGEFTFVGARLAADVELDRGDGRINETITLTTSGLWSIESDSGEDYLRENAIDELPMLVEDLKSLGFGMDEIKAAWTTQVDVVYAC